MLTKNDYFLYTWLKVKPKNQTAGIKLEIEAHINMSVDIGFTFEISKDNIQELRGYFLGDDETSLIYNYQ